MVKFKATEIFAPFWKALCDANMIITAKFAIKTKIKLYNIGPNFMLIGDASFVSIYHVNLKAVFRQSVLRGLIR